MQGGLWQHPIYGEIHEGPRNAGDAVEPEAADRGQVPGHDDAQLVTVGLGGVEGAYRELAGDLDLVRQSRCQLIRLPAGRDLLCLGLAPFFGPVRFGSQAGSAGKAAKALRGVCGCGTERQTCPSTCVPSCAVSVSKARQPALKSSSTALAARGAASDQEE